jgi:hypothetical protein
MACEYRNRRFALHLTVGLLVASMAGCSGSDGIQPLAGGATGTDSSTLGDAGSGGSGQGGDGGTIAATGGTVAPATGGVATGGTATGGKATGGTVTTGGTTASAGVASQYVDAVNAVRAAVTQPANYKGTWTPLPDVAWSDTVAASAKAWADNLAATQNCNLVHESQSTYGENLAMGTNLTPQQAVTMWASEKNLYTWSATYSMADFNAGSGHYTQLVWRKSIQIGCGSATCGRSVVISCRFSPPGNYIGQAVF